MYKISLLFWEYGRTWYFAFEIYWPLLVLLGNQKMLDAKSYVNLSNASLFFWAWLIGLLKGLRTYYLLLIKAVEGLSRYNLMKWQISSWLFTKLDNFLPLVYYMVEWSLHNKKLLFLLIHNCWKTKNWFSFFNHWTM